MGTQTKTLAEQVADGIMNLIQETPYKAGDKLPTEKELCESTGAGRNTVREALKILASRNVLEIRQGALCLKNRGSRMILLDFQW